MDYEGQEGLARALFEESGDALFLFDPDTDTLLDVNSMGQRLTGFPLRELLGRPMAKLFSFGGPGGLTRLHEVAGKTKAFHSQEGYFLCTARPNVWIPVNLTVSRLHVRPRTLALLTARDLREHYAVRNRLQLAEAELHQALSSASDCIWSADLDHAGELKYRYISPAVERITGQPPDFFLAGVHRWWGVIHPDDQGLWEKAFLRARGGQRSQEDYRVVTQDGGCRWVREEVRVAGRAPDGRCLRLDGVVRDITERRQGEEQRRGREGPLLALLNQSPLPAFLKDRHGHFLYVNPAYAARLGREPADVVGQRDTDLFPAEVASRDRESDAATLAGTQPVEALEGPPAGDGRRWRVLKFPVTVVTGHRLIGGLGTEWAGHVAPARLGGPR
jgi:PAS domain S-box-containing protein